MTFTRVITWQQLDYEDPNRQERILTLEGVVVYTGGGCMVGAIKGSTQREPLVVGKPSTFMMDHVTSKYIIHLKPMTILSPFKHASSDFLEYLPTRG